MRIGIEAQRIFRRKKHGMDIVALEIIRALQKIDDQNEYFIFVRKGEDPCLNETKNFRIIELSGFNYADWEQIHLPRAARKHRIDLLHCTSNTAPIFYRGRIVTTLHDVIFLEKGISAYRSNWYQLFGALYRKWVVPRSIQRADRVLTVSHYEKQEILQALDLDPNSIEVVYNAISDHFREHLSSDSLRTVRKKYGLPENYIFFIGNTDPKKNMDRVIRAYRAYCLRSSEALPLVMADVTENQLERLLQSQGLEILRKRVVLTGYIQNSDLPAIYGNASIFLYPSLRESFGIPQLEAMACGTPVISSSTSAMPEISGGAAYLVDPTDHQEIARALLAILEFPEPRHTLKAKGLERSAQFKWENSAQSLLNIYKEMNYVESTENLIGTAV